MPHISHQGVPSADLGVGFVLTIDDVPGQRAGTIFYGFNVATQPWAPLSTSYLCVSAPTQRTGSQLSGGSAGACDGSLSLDLNAWISTHPAALGAPFAPGQTLRAQGWYRDPAAPGKTNLSDALEFTLCAGPGDNVPPVFTSCAPDQTHPAQFPCVGVVPDFTAGVAVADACTNVTVWQVPAVGTWTSLGRTTVTVFARDVAGNVASCDAVLTITASPACSTPFGFSLVQPGTFQMGEVGVAEPVRQVTISYPFWIAQKEVTQAQLGDHTNYGFPGWPNFPAENVTWGRARSYCSGLTYAANQAGLLPLGYEYRLPTEAEWEYACRGGTQSSWNVGSSLNCQQANHNLCVAEPTNVGSYPPNALGLRDLHGNVWEWCLDSFAPYSAGDVTDPFVTGGSQRVLRGGSWFDNPLLCRSAHRFQFNPVNPNNSIGFRVVLAPIRTP
ncbi:MAG: formylglycine-generating enzyme family protein [Planctomycetaceae bacterium]|nr:formylglycine-generating enzyme family protein [Planctomycetaceae bacterium]